MGQQKQRSGTPVESQGAARQAGQVSQDFLKFLGGMPGGQDPRAALLGFDPSSLDLGGAARGLLADPASRTQGLFSAMEPFEAQETQRQTAGLREMFGAAGGRFSRGLAREEGNLRTNLGARFGLQRQQSLMDANAQRLQALASILGISTQAANPLFGFAEPGPAVFEPNTWQQLGSAAVDIGSTALPFFMGRN